MISTTAIVFTYILIMVFLCWSVIYSKGRTVFKCLGIGVALWYSFSFFYITQELKGWPTTKEMPEKAIVISFKVVEPENDNPGAFYFWCNLQPDLKKDLLRMLDPVKIFNYTGKVEPRAYKLPYDRELHKRLLEAKKKQGKIGGSFMQIEKKKGDKDKGSKGSNTIRMSEKIGFKIINPYEVLTKESQ